MAKRTDDEIALSAIKDAMERIDAQIGLLANMGRPYYALMTAYSRLSGIRADYTGHYAHARLMDRDAIEAFKEMASIKSREGIQTVQ